MSDGIFLSSYMDKLKCKRWVYFIKKHWQIKWLITSIYMCVCVYIYIYIIFIVDTIKDVLIPPTVACLHPAPTQPSLWPSPHCCLFCGFCIYVLWLIPSPSPAQSPTAPVPSDNCQSVPCVYDPLSILFVSLFCSLDSTCKWDQMVFVFLWLTDFT